MNDDLIKRSDAAEVVYKALKTPPLKGVLTDTMSLAIALVRDIPSANKPHGKWININNKLFRVQCSACKAWSDVVGNYCPWCGAHMKGADDE